MPEPVTNAGASPDPSGDGESEGLDLEQIREIGGFVLRSARRHPRLVVFAFCVVSGLGLVLAFMLPRTYSSQVKLLAQRSSAIHILGGANPQMDAVDNPINNVSAMILRRDNLVALVKDTHLVERFAETRPRGLRLKDQVMALFFGAPSAKDLEQAMVYTLEKRLEVKTDEPTSTLVISVEWTNPQLAYDLITLVQKNFLEARYDSDVAMVTDSIAVLEDHAKSELDTVDTELATYQRAVETWSAKRALHSPHASSASDPVAQAARAPGAGAIAGHPDPDLTGALEEKRLQIRAEEDAHRRNVETIRQELAQAQLTLTPMHPTVIALQQQLDAVSQPSADYLQLKNDERSLMAQIAGPGGLPLATIPFPHYATRDADGGAPSVGQAPTMDALDRDGQLQLAESKLASAIRGYEDALGRLDGAKVELEITRAAYKHQYTVVTPAELPNRPTKPTRQLVATGSLVGATILAILLATISDMLAGRILESWQIRRALKLDVLGELDKPA
jgi:uncharacterized protein involved in exopolysaccharide biosynthesis